MSDELDKFEQRQKCVTTVPLFVKVFENDEPITKRIPKGASLIVRKKNSILLIEKFSIVSPKGFFSSESIFTVAEELLVKPIEVLPYRENYVGENGVEITYATGWQELYVNDRLVKEQRSKW